MVQAYWLIGREIIEVEQSGEQRADYGDEIIERLAKRLTARLGQGFGARTLYRARQFYLCYPDGSALPPELGGPSRQTAALPPSKGNGKGKRKARAKAKAKAKILTAVLSESGATRARAGAGKPDRIPTAVLSESSRLTAAAFPPHLGWTHYLVLLRVADPTARAFYEIEAVRESWSSRELERQIASLLFERLTRSRDKEKVLALARTGQRPESPADVIKEPFVLEFLGLGEKSAWRERELEQAIIDRIGDFLLELGKGFCFVARQKRVTIDGDHFYIDLVFYNRLLRAFVLVDLKLGKLTHQDLGQMQMYVNFFDHFQRAEHEARTIGIVLCSEKNDSMAKITLPAHNKQILTARYQMYLPTEGELRAELAREREQAERSLRLAAEAGRPKSAGTRAREGFARFGRLAPVRPGPALGWALA
jgi:predicted nuclease of restriction endonuclease-like (RecB) superfamily